jgi:hypothetical protein
MPLSDATLRTIARLLPPEFRQRVFEPALADLILDERVALGARPRRWARLLLGLECLRLGWPLFVWRRHQPTRLAIAIVVAVTLVALATQRARYGERHAQLSATPVSRAKPP